MKEEIKTERVTFNCTKDMVERLDRMAELTNVPRSRLVLNMVEMGLGYLEATNKLGFLQLSLLIDSAQKKLKDLAKSWKEKKID